MSAGKKQARVEHTRGLVAVYRTAPGLEVGRADHAFARKRAEHRRARQPLGERRQRPRHIGITDRTERLAIARRRRKSRPRS
ncbi:hypothetical protein JQ557_15005 [Bradyrhizobium sp. U87765 SZCCT0131]|uniref:hypothetical protein n=1 Tax=unclassified Bradyrhizobium TaxID=2631580 RepID=UPI001BAB52A3|nr:MULTISPECIES: hypothetical protein [unclassified Bradyrhizobium]MBR1219311.1 hypothetical protein [Bradyrhizobium sp. U87765 SZCCT0131]MBR1261962.1 hypothetical protein [Bradyrhizobium sp. U87765 SZCCT0134]MBR1306185.1 hypothetical protein [Bradyrhizobium sp. U87765 SZCCT0110]MBR1317744.1 hypothetical protein [Bradyrhizobium sp. U87765 SZCCT0109]MBR1351446.1 hypothetical protein [Bradyrhizobium sp. U87765 SZCCT0048]